MNLNPLPQPAPELLKDLLKEMPGILKGGPVTENFPFSPLGEAGFPRGALIGLSSEAGGGKTECLLRFLAENSELRVAWVEERLTIFPSAFSQHGVSLERVLFVEGGIWAVHQLLRSQIFPVVVVFPEGAALGEEIALRRLQLAAGRARASVFLLTEAPILLRGASPWPISVQLQTQRFGDAQEIRVNLMKYRGNGSCSTKAFMGWVRWA